MSSIFFTGVKISFCYICSQCRPFITHGGFNPPTRYNIYARIVNLFYIWMPHTWGLMGLIQEENRRHITLWSSHWAFAFKSFLQCDDLKKHIRGIFLPTLLRVILYSAKLTLPGAAQLCCACLSGFQQSEQWDVCLALGITRLRFQENVCVRNTFSLRHLCAASVVERLQIQPVHKMLDQSSGAAGASLFMIWKEGWIFACTDVLDV